MTTMKKYIALTAVAALFFLAGPGAGGGYGSVAAVSGPGAGGGYGTLAAVSGPGAGGGYGTLAA